MIRWGKTNKGTLRWRCTDCSTTGVRKRGDVSKRNQEVLFRRWILGMESLTSIARKKHVSSRNLLRMFESQWMVTPHSRFPTLNEPPICVLDGTHISSGCVVLIILDRISAKPLGWSFARNENYTEWYALLSEFKRYTTPRAFVSDGQKGLRKALGELFPHTIHQRCMTHVQRLALQWLTKNPMSEAGKNLRKYIIPLFSINTKEEHISYVQKINRWDEKHDSFLKERSVSVHTGRKWYVHRKLRGVRSLLLTALPNLFHFLTDIEVPKTSNDIEGGINSPLKELLYRHRGLSTEKKKVLVTHFLCERRRNPPTRNVY